MDVAGVAINAAVVAAVGLILGWLGKGRFEAVDRRIDRLEERVDHRIDSLERRMDAFQTSIDAMRSDLTQVALAVGVGPRATNA
jgi:chaperonin cofactor prefoldin